ncbi:MAG: helix-turn-helix domain-containing protein, partial [Candidatus Pacebacteria bacterium]|nr:helix-turn-helix domain-containing protein [Candidatus Paceibacterota bacterium]
MIADISMPDFETRVAILKQKSDEKGIDLPKEVLDFVANNIQKNIRELESAINRLIIFKKTNNKNPGIEDVKKLLKNIIVSSSKITTPKRIIEAITDFYDTPSGNMFYSSRKKEFSKPRQIAMYLFKKELKLSYSEIGRKFGGKDHTTVIHACQLVEKLWEEDEKTHQEIELIIQRIYGT